MRNTIIVTVILFIAIIGASVYYFSDLKGTKKETLLPLTFLPKETFAIVTFHNDETTDHIFQDFEIFEAMVGRRELDTWKQLKTNLLRHRTLAPYVHNVNQYISFHPEDETISTLFTIPTLEPLDQTLIKSFLQNADTSYTVTEQDTLGSRIYSLDMGKADSIFHLVYHHDIFFATFSDSLLYHIIDDQHPKLEQRETDYFVANNSRNSPLSVYFVHDQIPQIADQLMRRKTGKTIALFEQLGGQSAWNLSFKNDALILTGESETAKHRENYLELFAGQRKASQSLYRYFPEHTATYLSFSISDMGQFQDGLQQLLDERKESTQLKAQFAELTRSKDIVFEDDVRPVFGREFAWVEQSNATELAFITVADTSLFNELLPEIATELSDSLYRFDHSNLPFALYGDPLKSFTRPYFLLVNDVLVLSNHRSVLQAYRRNWKGSRLLTNTLGFKNSERIQGNEANITYFSRTSTSSAIIGNLLRWNYRDNYRDKQNFGYQDFYSWAIQISGNNGDFQSSIYGVYRSENALGTVPEWVYAFDNRPITAPKVFEHSDTSQFILIQEQDHTVHAIHPSGNKLWSTVFHGRVVGEAQQLDDRSIVLATDRNRLYRFDPNGESLPGFSLGMDRRPTYQPTVGLIDGQQLIFVPAGQHILVYTLAGTPVDNWRDKELDGDILFDIKVHDNQVFVGTENGHFYQFDAQGELLKEEVIADSRFENPIAITNTTQNGIAVYAIDSAQVSYTLNFKDAPIPYQLERGGKQVMMAYFPKPDGTASRISLIDKEQLWVKNIQDTSDLFNYSFTQQVRERPQFFRDGSNGYLMGVASGLNDLIYLFNDKGAIQKGFPIQAMPGFYYGQIDYNGATYLLCVRRDRKLYAFKQE